jgi:hypothetical protein
VKESSVEDFFNSRIKALGGETRKLKWIGRNHAPDRMALIEGFQPTLVELKAPGKKPRPGQVREHERLRKCGYRVLVIDTHALVDLHFPLVP